MSDNPSKAQSKITSFFKTGVQRTLTTGLVPDRKRKLDDAELEENTNVQANKKQKINKSTTGDTVSIDDEQITRNAPSGCSKSSGKVMPRNDGLSPKLNTKPMLSKYCNRRGIINSSSCDADRAQTVSGTSLAASEQKTTNEPSRVRTMRAVPWCTTQMTAEQAGVTLVVAMGDLTHEQCDVIVSSMVSCALRLAQD